MSFIDGVNAGNAMMAPLLAGIETGRQRRRENTLAGLAGQFYGGDRSPSMLAQLAGSGADMAPYAKYGQEQDDRSALKLRGMAKYAQAAIQSGDPARIQAAYATIGPDFKQSFGKDLPPFDPTHTEAIDGILAQTQYLEKDTGRTGPMNISPGGEVFDPQTNRVLHSNTNFAPVRPTYDAIRGGFASPDGFKQVAPARPDYEGQRLGLAQEATARAAEASRRADEAARRASLGNAPPGMRFNASDALEAIPGAPPPAQTAEVAKTSASQQALAKDAYSYAAADTGVDADTLRQMKPEQVRDLINGIPVRAGGKTYSRQTRWGTGPIAGRIPGMGFLANADLEAYRNASAGKQARINNPTGPVTNADFEVGAKSVWGPDKPDSVNSQLVYDAIRQQAASAAAPAQAGPTAAPKATEGQIIENAQGVRLQLRGGKWTRVN